MSSVTYSTPDERDQLHPLPSSNSNNNNNKPSRALLRRKSSGLGGEIRAGDTGAPSITTLNVTRVDSPAATKVSFLHLGVIVANQQVLDDVVLQLPETQAFGGLNR